jgi:hypothetical protein
LDLIVIPSLNVIEPTSSSITTTSTPSSNKGPLSTSTAQNTTKTEKSTSKLNEDLGTYAAKTTTLTNSSINLINNKNPTFSTSSIDTSNKSNTRSDLNNTNSSSLNNFTTSTSTNTISNINNDNNQKATINNTTNNSNNSKLLSSFPLSKSIVAAASSLITSSPTSISSSRLASSFDESFTKSSTSALINSTPISSKNKTLNDEKLSVKSLITQKEKNMFFSSNQFSSNNNNKSNDRSTNLNASDSNNPNQQMRSTNNKSHSPVKLSSSLRDHANFSSFDSTSNNQIISSNNQNSLGMSSIFNSFINKNNSPQTKNSLSSPPDSGYDSRQDTVLNSNINNKLSTLDSSKQKSTTSNNNLNEPIQNRAGASSSPITQVKLKKLQEALTKHYSKEQLTQLGIVIPGVNSDPNDNNNKIDTNLENIARNYLSKIPNSADINLKTRHSSFNESTHVSNTNVNQSPSSNKLSTNRNYSIINNSDYPKSNETPQKQEYLKYSSFLTSNKETFDAPSQQHPFYYDAIDNYNSSQYSNSRQSNYSSTAYNPKHHYHHYANSSSTVQSPTPTSSSVQSPISVMSSTSIMSTTSNSSSTNSSTAAGSSTNTASTLNNNMNTTPVNPTNTNNASSNKASPFIFSKYIERVHKALHHSGINQSGANTPSSYRASSAASSENNSPLVDLYDRNMKLGIQSSNNNNSSNNSQFEYDTLLSRRLYAEAPRSFEHTLNINTSMLNGNKNKLTNTNELNDESEHKSLRSSVKSPFYFKSANSPNNSMSDSNKNSNVEHEYDSNINTSSTSKPSNSSQSLNNNKPNESNAIRSSSNLYDLNSLRASSIGGIGEYTSSSKYPNTNNNNNNNNINDNNKKVNLNAASFNLRSSSSHFNHTNRASYKGECKRIMSRANMETVAERAAHFEDIDPERYNRIRSRLYELDQEQQQNEQQYSYLNQYYPFLFNNSNSSNSSNLNLLNNYVESLMMSPTLANTKTNMSRPSSLIQNNKIKNLLKPSDMNISSAQLNSREKIFNPNKNENNKSTLNDSIYLDLNKSSKSGSHLDEKSFNNFDDMSWKNDAQHVPKYFTGISFYLLVDFVLFV